MKIKYSKQIVDILYNEWDLGKKSSNAKGKTCAWIYWFEILSEAEKAVIEKQDGKVIGVCAYTKWNSKKYFFRKKFYGLLKNILIHSPLVENKEEIYKYNENYNYLPQKFENYFDGEISLLIVDKECRGKKIGEKLLKRIFELASKDNMRNIQILSDESCNYKFYEKLNCNKIYETTVDNGEPGKLGDLPFSKAYIYEKIL